MFRTQREAIQFAGSMPRGDPQRISHDWPIGITERDGPTLLQCAYALIGLPLIATSAAAEAEPIGPLYVRRS